jgi:hypothetical protein
MFDFLLSRHNRLVADEAAQVFRPISDGPADLDVYGAAALRPPIIKSGWRDIQRGCGLFSCQQWRKGLAIHIRPFDEAPGVGVSRDRVL